jgi:hypothetical protein
MNLRLPSARRLPEPDRIVDRILAESPATRRPGRNRLRVAVNVATAAAVTITATILGISTVHDQQRLTEAPPATVSPQPPTPRKPPATHPVGTTVTFPDIVVTVGSADHVRVNNDPTDLYTVFVTTCVRSLPPGSRNGRVQLRADSWTVGTGSATITIDDPISARVPLPTTYPFDGSYKPGQCVSGVIPFGVGSATMVRSIDYTNSFGDNASWTP